MLSPLFDALLRSEWAAELMEKGCRAETPLEAARLTPRGDVPESMTPSSRARGHTPEGTGCSSLRQPLHSYSWQLFCAAFYGVAAPRHASPGLDYPRRILTPPLSKNLFSKRKFSNTNVERRQEDSDFLCESRANQRKFM